MPPCSELPEPLEKDHARRSLDQREMGERLREVPQMPPCRRVVFLGNGKNPVPQARVAMQQEFEVSGQQRRAVERNRLIVLAQHASITDTMSEDVRPDLVRRCSRHVAAIL